MDHDLMFCIQDLNSSLVRVLLRNLLKTVNIRDGNIFFMLSAAGSVPN